MPIMMSVVITGRRIKISVIFAFTGLCAYSSTGPPKGRRTGARIFTYSHKGRHGPLILRSYGRVLRSSGPAVPFPENSLEDFVHIAKLAVQGECFGDLLRAKNHANFGIVFNRRAEIGIVFPGAHRMSLYDPIGVFPQ